MTLGDSLLESLNGHPSNGVGPFTHSQTTGDWTATIVAERCDSVGCLLRELTLTQSNTDGSPMPVGPWAERIASRVTGLMEPLKVLEVDPEQNEAVLRSTSPSRKNETAHYYELLLAGRGHATLKRFKADFSAGTRREQVSFALTNEAVAKLADDLVRD